MDIWKSILSLVRVPIFLPAIASANDEVAGTWRGESSCVQREPGCHDETVVYRFSPILENPKAFLVIDSKIIDGRAIPMGAL